MLRVCGADWLRLRRGSADRARGQSTGESNDHFMCKRAAGSRRTTTLLGVIGAAAGAALWGAALAAQAGDPPPQPRSRRRTRTAARRPPASPAKPDPQDRVICRNEEPPTGSRLGGKRDLPHQASSGTRSSSDVAGMTASPTSSRTDPGPTHGLKAARRRRRMRLRRPFAPRPRLAHAAVPRYNACAFPGGLHDRDGDRGAQEGPRRVRGRPHPALRQAADGGAVHLPRPHGSGRLPARPGRGRAPAPAHRPVDRDLPVRGRADPQGLAGLRPGHPAGRGQLDDGGQGHHPFRAHRHSCAARPARACTACRPGSPCRRSGRRSSRASTIIPGPTCPPTRARGSTPA